MNLLFWGILGKEQNYSEKSSNSARHDPLSLQSTKVRELRILNLQQYQMQMMLTALEETQPRFKHITLLEKVKPDQHFT